MRKADWKLGKALTVVTVVYLICSIFGCALYMVLPPVLSSIGARIHAYLLYIAAMDDSRSILPVVFAIAGHLLVLLQVVFGFIGLKTGHVKPFAVLTLGDILLTLVFLLGHPNFEWPYTCGILVNLGYCLWLFRFSLIHKTAAIK